MREPIVKGAAAAPGRSNQACVLAITGMTREAAGIARDGVEVVVSGGDQMGLVARFEAAVCAVGADNVAAVISIGLGGGLDPALRPGDAVVAETIAAGPQRHAADARWTRRITALLPNVRVGVIAGQDMPAADPESRHRLFQATGAVCVDMESHTAARLAEAQGLPFAALRFISDGAGRTLPTAALAGMRPDGSISVLAVMAALARNPLQLPDLIRTGIEAEAGFKALFSSCSRLGPSLGFRDV